MNDQQTIKKLQAQLEVANDKTKALIKKNNTLVAKADKWEMAKTTANTLNEIKQKLDTMKVDGMTISELRRYTTIKDVLDDFFEQYGDKL